MSTSCYINQFRPLAETLHGRNAIAKHNLPPFIDASCRREPDLESQFPSITAICREEYFAPRLQEGDVVAYMTKDIVYPPETESARRLVAVLRVEKSWLEHRSQRGLEAHTQAAAWYQRQGLPVPSNCMVSDEGRMSMDRTDCFKSDLEDWDAVYRLRAIKCGAFHACEKIFCDVNNPPRLTNPQLLEWFRTIPDTRSLPPLTPKDFATLLRWLAVETTDTNSSQLLKTLATELANSA
jgi:hypothetical protein